MPNKNNFEKPEWQTPELTVEAVASVTANGVTFNIEGDGNSGS